jgi:hypothetical protein
MSKELVKYGRPDELRKALGLTGETAEGIASIISFAALIEHYLERAIWRLSQVDPRGVRPSTDGKPITELIAMLEALAGREPHGDVRTMLELWCDAARSAFVIRNNIAHGVPVRMETMTAFMRNTQWHGEKRNRAFGDFWTDPHALSMACSGLAVLARLIGGLALNEGAPPAEAATQLVLRALRDARSVLGELSSQDYNPSFEKY